MDKKGQIGGLQGFILSIVTVTIVLAIGLIVISEMQITTKEMHTTSVNNESVTITSDAGTVVQGSPLFISASACRNVTDPEVTFVLGLHCNVSSTGAVKVAAENYSDIVGIDYSHYTPSAAYNSSGTIITKLATVPTWIGIIIIVALAFIVLSFFIGKRQ